MKHNHHIGSRTDHFGRPQHSEWHVPPKRGRPHGIKHTTLHSALQRLKATRRRHPHKHMGSTLSTRIPITGGGLWRHNMPTTSSSSTTTTPSTFYDMHKWHFCDTEKRITQLEIFDTTGPLYRCKEDGDTTKCIYAAIRSLKRQATQTNNVATKRNKNADAEPPTDADLYAQDIHTHKTTDSDSDDEKPKGIYREDMRTTAPAHRLY